MEVDDPYEVIIIPGEIVVLNKISKKISLINEKKDENRLCDVLDILIELQDLYDKKIIGTIYYTLSSILYRKILKCKNFDFNYIKYIYEDKYKYYVDHYDYLYTIFFKLLSIKNM